MSPDLDRIAGRRRQVTGSGHVYQHCRLDRLLHRAQARPDAGELVAAAARCYATSGQPPAAAAAARILEQAGKTQKLFFSRTLRVLMRARNITRAGQNTRGAVIWNRLVLVGG